MRAAEDWVSAGWRLAEHVVVGGQKGGTFSSAF